MARRVLLIAFQFPPFAASSAVQRTLRFAQYLPECGWEPVVLSAHPRAFGRTSDALMREIPAGVHVERAFAVDAARHLSVRGWYPGFMGWPDRWSSWLFGAVPAGLRLIRRFRPDVIWSTYPIATAPLLGLILHKLSGVPWIADFRDPMYDETYPTNPTLRRVHQTIENWAVHGCSRAVFTTPGAVGVYAARYPDVPTDRFALVQNGYDEASFEGLEQARPPDDGFRGITLLHSGVVYPVERDPSALFGAVSDLAKTGRIKEGEFRLLLRATGHDQRLGEIAQMHGVNAFVVMRPAIAYRDALAEMTRADGLLVLQGADCTYQIPAKVYECLRAGRPILGLVGENTDTGMVLRSAGLPYVTSLHDRDSIRATMERFLDDLRAGTAVAPRGNDVVSHTRRSRTRELSSLLDSVSVRGAA